MDRRANALQVLLSELIDYAGMYPPESLSLEEAVSNYFRHRSGPQRWMLGVFLCPSSQLHDLEWILGGEPAPVGVVIDQPIPDAVDAISSSGLQIRQIETRDLSIAERLDALPSSCSLWLEADPKRVLDVASEKPGRRIGVKVRCGGGSSADFPSVEALADLMQMTFACGLPLKATAGLHHPWRHYWPDLEVWRHGFLNLAAAATSLVLTGDQDDAVMMLSATAGRLDRSGLRVGGRAFTVADLRSARVFLRTYGSCSFDEPVDDLVAMGSLW